MINLKENDQNMLVKSLEIKRSREEKVVDINIVKFYYLCKGIADEKTEENYKSEETD